ncbi:hypothetical protein VTN77DRAFT_3876 [Rasamsonia byssochlamydoides]|uniref:uncharacterized protein n=1 Tax=Rasamsonia byssochlamydoides TaxID=89139 RepID=UPI0037423467
MSGRSENSCTFRAQLFIHHVTSTCDLSHDRSSPFHPNQSRTTMNCYSKLLHSTYLSAPVQHDACSKSNSFCVAFSGNRIGNGGLMMVCSDFISTLAASAISWNRCLSIYRPNMPSKSRTRSRAASSRRKSALEERFPPRIMSGVIGRKRRSLDRSDWKDATNGEDSSSMALRNSPIRVAWGFSVRFLSKGPNVDSVLWGPR